MITEERTLRSLAESLVWALNHLAGDDPVYCAANETNDIMGNEVYALHLGRTQWQVILRNEFGKCKVKVAAALPKTPDEFTWTEDMTAENVATRINSSIRQVLP